MDKETACKICGRKHWNHATRLCDGCWEVTHRLDDFLKAPAARAYVAAALARAADEPPDPPDPDGGE